MQSGKENVMEKEMTGADRRKRILFLMRESDRPLSGAQLGSQTGVSRQAGERRWWQNVLVNHRVYGRMEAALNIKNRRDVQMFLNDLRTGKSVPLLNITSGYHFHRIAAETRAT